ncbi:MAG: hypothetical protein HOW73_00825 [Polyangiaceae bacterium]|nr:hypothetical protein [Polyangiaceae bacterium]
MGSADWTVMPNSLSSGDVVHAATRAISPPAGGGSFVHAFNSLTGTVGVVALRHNQAGFAPIAPSDPGGGAIEAALVRMGAACSVLVFFAAQVDDVSTNALMLGLDAAGHISLRKGLLAAGLPDAEPGSSGVLLRSSEAVALGSWAHLRLEIAHNGCGDSCITCWRNLGSVGAPTWAPIFGMNHASMPHFVDDGMQIASRSAPLLHGFSGFAFRTEGIGGCAGVDAVTLRRQLAS